VAATRESCSLVGAFGGSSVASTPPHPPSASAETTSNATARPIIVVHACGIQLAEERFVTDSARK
jgi:hypothetical protein